jgi:hypothetical protein
MKIEIKVKCVCCGNTKTVNEEQKDIPLCDNWGSPMIVEVVTKK